MYRGYTILMKYSFDYSPEKDALLKTTRTISFEDIIEAVRRGRRLADLKHKKYPNQRLFASRKLTRKYFAHEE